MDSEEENEEVRAASCVQVMTGRQLRVCLAGQVNDIALIQSLFVSLLTVIEAIFSSFLLGIRFPFCLVYKNWKSA